jgi:hypothetical protein
MMGKSYQRKTNRSKRKMPSPPQGTVSVETADGQARFQMMLPMNLLLFDVAAAIEETARQCVGAMTRAT